MKTILILALAGCPGEQTPLERQSVPCGQSWTPVLTVTATNTCDRPCMEMPRNYGVADNSECETTFDDNGQQSGVCSSTFDDVDRAQGCCLIVGSHIEFKECK